jgi:hypothetical protein
VQGAKNDLAGGRRPSNPLEIIKEEKVKKNSAEAQKEPVLYFKNYNNKDEKKQAALPVKHNPIYH